MAEGSGGQPAMQHGFASVAAAAIALGALASVLVAAGVQATAADQASYSHTQGLHAWGDLEGHCSAYAFWALDGVPSSIEIRFDSARLRIFQTWINSTFVLPEDEEPVRVAAHAEQAEVSMRLGRGNARVDLPAHGRSALIGAGAYLGPVEPFPLTFTAQEGVSGPPRANHAVAQAWVASSEGTHEVRSHIQEPARFTLLHGADVVARGDAAFHLEGARIVAAGLDVRLAQKPHVEDTEAPGLRWRSERVEHALLEVEGATLQWRSQRAAAVCGPVWLSVQGSIDLHHATGLLRSHGSHPFSGQEVRLEGAFSLAETVATAASPGGPVQGHASGRFERAFIDHQAVAGGTDAATAATAALVTGVGLALAALGVFLYTTLRPHHLFRSPERRALFDLVLRHPNLTLNGLLQHHPTSATNARYHLRVLERAGFIEIVVVRGRHHYLPAGADPVHARRNILMETDPKLRYVVSRVTGCELPASVVVDDLQEEWGLSRAGAWKVLHRARRAGIIETSARQRRMVVRA